jgi:hypothetical protein
MGDGTKLNHSFFANKFSEGRNMVEIRQNKSRLKAAKLLKSLVAGVGFEPTTFRL